VYINAVDDSRKILNVGKIAKPLKKNKSENCISGYTVCKKNNREEGT
jgi:hypothetical protein